jgi:2-oxoglutarate ferredoxin oxidoreductase subunit alpha
MAHPFRTGIPVKTILEQEDAPSVMRNTAILGAFCKAISIPWMVLEDVITRYQPKKTELNLKVARRGYDLATEKLLVDLPGGGPVPVVGGLEATGLGLIRGGLKAYAGYPMTPASGLLHFLARQAPRFELKVVQPEGEIAAMLMALGHAYAGERAAVGTSGGGFALMVEGLSLAGQAELPIVVVLGQRPGPSTGLPTYTAQGDLEFALSAGHGEFPRAVIAPGDVEQAYGWSTLAMDLAWKYQLPVIVLGDRTLNDNAQSLVEDEVPTLPRLAQKDWDGVPMDKDPSLAYKRYVVTEDGVSPLAFPGREGAVVKVNSYTHDEFGVTTEDPATSVVMQDKWLRKGRAMAEELDTLPAVNVYGDPRSPRTVVTWGSPVGALREIADLTGLRVVQPVVLWPFPQRQLAEALAGSDKVLAVEMNATGQFAGLMRRHALRVDDTLLRYDGRPWGVGELRQRVEEVVA